MKYLLFLSVALTAFFPGAALSAGAAGSSEDLPERAYLGIYSGRMSKAKAALLGFDTPYGSYVTKILPGTAAEAAGVQVFDYIYGIDALRTGEEQSLTAILRKFEAGDRVELYLIRRSDRIRLPVTLGSRSDAQSVERGECQDPFFGIQHEHRYRPERGVGIAVVRNSTAEAMGLESGDIITSINGYPIIDWEDISTAINNMEVGELIRVEYLRDGRQRQDSRRIQSRCDTERQEERYGFDDQYYGQVRSTLKVRIQNAGNEELRSLRNRYDIDLSSDNTLPIEDLAVFSSTEAEGFRLEFNLPQAGATRIRLYNQVGRQLYNYELGNFSGPFSDEVNIAQNGEGVYFLEVRQEGRAAVRKILLSDD